MSHLYLDFDTINDEIDIGDILRSILDYNFK